MRPSFLLVLAVLSAPAGEALAQSAVLLRSHTTPGQRDYGSAVAAAGDLDADGRPDYLVGAPDLGKFGSDGSVYAYSGATGVLLRTFAAPTAGREARFGASVASVGDLTGDGVTEVLVGEPDTPGAFQEAGRAYLFNGATGARLRTLTPPASAASGSLGASVGPAGDVDGDGVPDALVGATRAAGFVGQAFVYSGATGAVLRTFNTPTPRNGGGFGTTVASVADANADGVRDVLVGAPGEGATSFAGFGHVHLFSGATGALLRTVVSPQPSDTGRFGRALAVGPDVTGDGRGDVLIGEPNGGPGMPGKVYLYDPATNTFPRTFDPPPTTPNTRVGSFGDAVAWLGDLTLDGIPDVLIGDPNFAVSNQIRPGRVHLYDGATAQELADVRSSQPGSDGDFGEALAAVGDVDGDGDVDFVAGAPSESSGRAYVFGAVPGVVVIPPGLISEYVEGSGFNRAVEIYNDSASPLSLAGYTVRLFLNGADTPSATIALSGTLAPGDVFVVADENAAPAVLAVADLTTATLLFNGNDAVGLYAGDELLDLIGQIGQDPGTEWGSGAASTADNTLRREGDACAPDADSTNAFVPAPTYTGYPVDTFAGLGSTTLTCAGPTAAAPDVPTPGAPLALSAASPNPTAGPVRFALTVATAGAVRVEAFDALGRRVAVIHDGALAAGPHALAFDATALPAGLYVVRARAADGATTVHRRLVVSR